MNKYVALGMFAVFALVPLTSRAETVLVASAISADTTWTKGNVYVIDSNFRVEAGVTLTLEAGTIVKAKTTGMSLPSIYGRLLVLGTAQDPVYITSFYNDSVGGDTDGFGDTGLSQGEWQGLYFKQGSEGVFEYADISYSGYGGSGYGNYTAIENSGAVRIKNSRLHDNFRLVNVWGSGPVKTGSAILNKGGDLYIEGSVVEGSLYGIYDEGGNVEATSTTFKDNFDSTGYSTGYGIYASGSGRVILKNNTFQNNDKATLIDIGKVFIHVGNTSSDQKERGFGLFGTAVGNSVIEGGDLPIVLDNGLLANAGSSITVRAGTLIKGRQNGSLSVVGGVLNIEGTKESPVVFTSIHDDTEGGDTNNNGSATKPEDSHLYKTAGIQVGQNAKAHIKNLKLKYSGSLQYIDSQTGTRAGLVNIGGEVLVEDSIVTDHSGVGIQSQNASTTVLRTTFDNSAIPIHLNGGSFTVTQSRFIPSPNYQLQNYGSTVMNARNNWWGDASGPYHETLNPTGKYGSIQQNIDFIPWLTTDPALTSDKQNPVIIIPGIMGSAKNSDGTWVIDPILHTYDNLVATLEANGYEENKTLFTFPYEWRDSNILTANLLKDKIAMVKEQCTNAGLVDIDCSKVDLVAHSMGGLATREYVQSGQYRGDVDQLIFLGVPHNGSAESYLVWEAGEFSSEVFKFAIGTQLLPEMIKNGYLGLTEYIHGRPISSVQELLPIFDYLKDKDTGVVRAYPNNYPRNIFLEALNSRTSNLLNSGVRITNFVGNTGNNTIDTIRVIPSSDSKKWIDGEPDGFVDRVGDRGLERSVGDGTVSIYSASLGGSLLSTELSSEHRALPTGAEGDVVKILTGKDSVENVNHGLIYNMLIVRLYSPVDMLITAPDGKKMGKDFVSGQVFDQIPQAFYSGYTAEDEFITIPNPLDGEYKIELQGVDGGGKYEVSTSYISETVSTTTQAVGTTKENQVTTFSVDLDAQKGEVLPPKKVVTPDTLLNDINGSYDLGWIKDKKTRDSLIKQVDATIKFSKKIEKVKEKLPDGSVKEKRVERFSVKVNKILAKLFEKEIEALYKKGKITKEAYDLLVYDLKYLINN